MALITAARISLLALTLAGIGCSKKNDEKCDEATQNTRKAAEAADFQLARQWRDRAYKYCRDTGALQALDGELATKERETTERKAREERRLQEAKQLLGVFTDWVAKSRQAPERAGANPQCKGPADTKARWCEIDRKVGDAYTVEAEYWEEDPQAVVFRTRIPQKLECKDLGDHALIKTWTVNGTQRSYCDITGGPLAGMKALVSSVPDQTDLKVFTPKLLERDAAMRSVVEG
jgi:hypothetical protein